MFEFFLKKYQEWRFKRACRRFAEVVFRESPMQKAMRLKREERFKFKTSFRANSSDE